ncbi:MAG: hypothetical protein J07AB43_00390 [Candidatus Nanosalina sp. J07AB43]|jgi:hypothetical protein|nr:MAG: hypothetical protein J07AB43_00390 [Candidatus Nanosalina sp. J07AB43]
MVSDMMDMLGRDEAEPEELEQYEAPAHAQLMIELVEEIASDGEAIVTFNNNHTTEFHGDDTHFYTEYGVMFTEDETPDGEEAETWYSGRDIVSVQRH